MYYKFNEVKIDIVKICGLGKIGILELKGTILPNLEKFKKFVSFLSDNKTSSDIFVNIKNFYKRL